MKLRGTVRFRDIEAGVWVLEGDDGVTYALAGGDRHLKRDGEVAEVEGEVSDSPNAHMVGPVIRVRRYSFP